jgi:hypothetical protein
MKVFVFLLGGFVFSIYSFAQVAGPNSGTIFTNVPFTGSSASWTGTGNAISSDNSYASFGNLPNNSGPTIRYTDYLQITGFNFSIPPAVIINGIVVEIERSDPNLRTSDYRIQIVKGGVIGTTDRSASASYPVGDSYQSFGNSGDLWGETWTDADINSANFGIAISARRSANGGITAGQVDHVRITVFYDFVSLPLKLNLFSGRQNGKNILLNWSTSDESNMSYFELQTSSNARDFSKLAQLPIRNNSSSNYSFTDTDPEHGSNYYRLKITEASGKAYYSGTVAVQFKKDKVIYLYPNPLQAGSNLFVNNREGEKLTIQFYNAEGKLTASFTTSSNQIPQSLINTQTGTVYYRITNAENRLVGKGLLVLQ